TPRRGGSPASSGRATASRRSWSALPARRSCTNSPRGSTSYTRCPWRAWRCSTMRTAGRKWWTAASLPRSRPLNCCLSHLQAGPAALGVLPRQVMEQLGPLDRFFPGEGLCRAQEVLSVPGGHLEKELRELVAL